MELKTANSKIFGETICFPDLGDVEVSKEGVIEVPENILENVDFASLGFYTESQILELSKAKETQPLSEQPLDTTKTKSEIIKELQTEIETLKSQSTDEEVLAAINTLNEENEKLLKENSSLKAQIEALTKTQSTDKKDKKQ